MKTLKQLLGILLFAAPILLGIVWIIFNVKTFIFLLIGCSVFVLWIFLVSYLIEG